MTFNIAEHPGVAVLAVVTLVMAGIGTWYVVRNHLRLILLTVLCGFGFFAGGLVVYRGAHDPVLVGVGIFLLIIFPAIWMRAIGSQSAPPPKGPPPQQTLGSFELELRPKQTAAAAPPPQQKA